MKKLLPLIAVMTLLSATLVPSSAFAQVVSFCPGGSLGVDGFCLTLPPLDTVVDL
jgi:hypothetical protein